MTGKRRLSSNPSVPPATAAEAPVLPAAGPDTIAPTPAAGGLRHGLARRLTRPFGFVDEAGVAWHWRVGQVVTGDVLLALEGRGAPLGEAEPEAGLMRVKADNRFAGKI